jgi:hypothetical protein
MVSPLLRGDNHLSEKRGLLYQHKCHRNSPALSNTGVPVSAYFNVVFRSFPQENEKNNKATLISVKLISVALGLAYKFPVSCLDQTTQGGKLPIKTWQTIQGWDGTSGF